MTTPELDEQTDRTIRTVQAEQESSTSSLRQFLLTALLLLAFFLVCISAAPAAENPREAAMSPVQTVTGQDLPSVGLPDRALISFNGATVFGRQSLPLAQDGEHFLVRLLIPASAQDFQAMPEGAVVADIAEKTVFAPSQGSQDRYYADLVREKAGLEAEVLYLQTMIGRIGRSAADAGGEEQLRSLCTRLGEVKVRLDGIGSMLANSQTGSVVTSWKLVTLRLADCQAGDSLTVSYSYRMASCTWQPVYTLDCQPQDSGQGRINVRLEAEIRQPEAMDWKGTEIVLVAGNTGSARIPGLSTWILGDDNRPMPIAGARAYAVAEMAAGDNAAAKRSTARLDTSGNYATWKPLMTGLSQGTSRLLLARTTWQEKLVWTARPLNSDARVFLCTSHSLDGQEVAWPSGRMSLSVDGVHAGSDTFAPRDGKVFLSFGHDARVRLETVAEPRKSGQEGLIGKKKVWEWEWTYTVHNDRDQEIAVRLERPLPRNVNRDAELTFTTSPAAVRDDKSLSWDLTVPAGGSQKVTHGVKFSAPADTELSPVAP